MDQMTPTPLIVSSERIYRALLILYPAGYRREYGSLMVQFFRDVSRDRYHTDGLAGILWWWCSTLLDLTLTAIEQWRKVRFGMSKATFMQLAGTLLVLGGALSGLAAFSQLQPGNHYSYYGIYQVLIWLYAPGCLLIGLGCIGLALRYGLALGKPGQWALILSGLGSVAMAFGLAAISIQDSLWTFWMLAGLVHTVSLTLFGLLHLRRPALPVFRALPVMIASGWIMMMLGGLRTNSQAANNALAFLLFLGIGLAWLQIGLSANRQQRAAAPAAA